MGRQSARTPKRRLRGGYIVLFSALTALLATNTITALALYFAPEINTLFRQDNSAVLTAYEQRITQLRLEVDRLHSRQYAQMGDMNLQMHELVQQQEVLFEQHEYVRALTDMARELGIASDEVETDPTLTGAISAPAASFQTDSAAIAETLVSMQEETRLALVSLSDAATLSTNEIVEELQRVGITPAVSPSGIGGPFIPAATDDLSIIEEANAVADALSRYQTARRALLTAPIQTPVPGGAAVTSNFGNRTDPFLKRAAFHAGMDFRAGTGTPVHAAANGTVSFAGSNGGYGKMVEIDHGNGLKSRYAHLSRIDVVVGQAISGGVRLGAAGSTGRSTGPHLHFEVRRNGSAINPGAFIAAGRNLAHYFQ